MSYNGVQNNAHDAAVSADLKKMADKLKLYKGIYKEYPGIVISGVNRTVSGATFDTTIINDTKSGGVLKFSKNSYGKPFTASSNNFIRLLAVRGTTTTTEIVDYCLVAVSKSGQAFWITSQNPTPQKGPYGSPQNSLTNALTQSECSNRLGYTLGAAGQPTAVYSGVVVGNSPYNL